MSNPSPQTDNNFNFPANPQGNPSNAITVTSNAHPVIRSGDMSLWDSTSGVFVTPEQTNTGTGGICTGSSGKVNYPNQ